MQISTTRSTTGSGETHTDAEWESIKAAFITLYKVEDKPLPLVRRILGEKYGFRATTRQYKTRILKWGARKKDDERQPQASTPTSQRGSPPVRHGYVAQDRAAHTPRSIRNMVVSPVQQQLTPPVSRSPTPPGHLRSIEFAAYGIESFYLGVLHENVDRSQVRNQTPDWNIRQFFDVANALSAVVSASQWKPAQQLYGELLDHAVPLLYERNPIVVVCVVQACCRFLQEGSEAVLQRFLSFLERIAASRGLESHPLRLLATAWMDSGEHFMDLMTTCAQQAGDVLRRELGPDHPQTLSAGRAVVAALLSKEDYSSALKHTFDLLEREQMLFVNSYSTVDLQLRLARCFLSMNDQFNASKVLQTMEVSVLKLSEAGVAEALLRKMRSNMLATKGELLRLQRDPEGKVLIEELLDDIKNGAETHNIWLRLQLERQLAAFEELSLEDTALVPFKFPC